MEILQINENNVAELDSYILNKSLNDYLYFYKFSKNSEYLEVLKQNALKSNSISLIGIKNNNVVGFMVGEIVGDESLKVKIAKVVSTISENSYYYQLLLNKFERIAKKMKCEYISVCIPEFQKETLNNLNSNGFSKYKVEFEKKLV